jgi:hypothetical protein
MIQLALDGMVWLKKLTRTALCLSDCILVYYEVSMFYVACKSFYNIPRHKVGA